MSRAAPKKEGEPKPGIFARLGFGTKKKDAPLEKKDDKKGQKIDDLDKTLFILTFQELSDLKGFAIYQADVQKMELNRRLDETLPAFAKIAKAELMNKSLRQVQGEVVKQGCIKTDCIPHVIARCLIGRAATELAPLVEEVDFTKTTNELGQTPLHALAERFCTSPELLRNKRAVESALGIINLFLRKSKEFPDPRVYFNAEDPKGRTIISYFCEIGALKLIDSVLISAKQFGIEPTHLLDHVTKNPKASSCTTPRQFLTQAAPAPSPDMPLVLINTDKLIVDLGDEPKEVAAKQEAQRKDHMQLAPGLWNDAEAAIAAIGDDITNQEKIERAKAALKEMSDVGLINWQNPVKNGNGIIHLVAASRCEELTMQVVEDQTVDISLTNNLGQTALHVFAESTGNNRDLIRYEEMQFEKDQKQQVEGQAHKKDVGKKLPADELTERIATKITNAGTTLAARSAQYPGLIGLKDKQGRTAIYSAAEQVAKGGAVTIMGIINFEPALLYDEKEGGESPLAKAKQGASKKGLEWLQKKEAEKARPQPDKKAAESVNAASSGKQVSGDKKEKAEIEGEAQDPSEPGTEKKASKPAAQPAAVGVTPESAGKLQQQQQQGGHRSKT